MPEIEAALREIPPEEQAGLPCELILLDRDGKPRIRDFALARRVADQGGLTVTGQVLGTPSFMQAAGRSPLVPSAGWNAAGPGAGEIGSWPA